jgi:hypothetical protein
MRRFHQAAVALTLAACIGAGGAGASHGASSTACRVKGGLQDSVCTPGAVFRSASTADVCRPGYAGSVRNVPESVKRAVYAKYGIAGSHHGSAYEVDHLISLELGGSNSIANLWPEAASPKPGFHEKDAVENLLHRRVCDGTISLRTAQRLIKLNWLKVFRGIGH